MSAIGEVIRDSKRHVSPELQAQHDFATVAVPTTTPALQSTGFKTVSDLKTGVYAYGLVRLPDVVAEANGIPELPVSVANAEELKEWVDANVPAGKYLLSLPTEYPLLDYSWMYSDGTAWECNVLSGIIISIFSFFILLTDTIFFCYT